MVPHCVCVFNSFTKSLEANFAEKQQSQKFELFMYYVIHVKTVNSLRVVFVVIHGVKPTITSMRLV